MSSPDRNAWVARVLGIVVAQPPAPETDDTKNRLAAVAGDIKRIPGGEALMDELRAAIALAKTAAPETEAAIEALEEAVAERARATRLAAMTAELAAARPSKVGFVAVAKARMQWAQVEASVEVAAGNLVDSARALLATPPYRDDPRASDPEAMAAIERLRERLPPLGTVTDAVNAALDADGHGRTAAIASAVATIDAFMPRLQGDANLIRLETEAGSFPTVSLIGGALQTLRDALSDVGAEPADSERLRSAA